MRTRKLSSAEDHKLISSFEAVRKLLLKEGFADRREKPLAYWALPNDRRLPLAFLGRSVGELLDTPFDVLSATPGIGQKKISTLVKLLQRAVADEPSVPFGIRELADEQPAAAGVAEPLSNGAFEAASVSESIWAKWQQTVRQHRLGELPLGQLAPSLQEIPTVIWHKPIGDYLDYSIAEIRGLKTHGEKRVRVVLEVFRIIHVALANTQLPDHLEVRLIPRFVNPIAVSIETALRSPSLPGADLVRSGIVEPLLDQIKLDAGETVHTLAAGRLGVLGAAESVREQAGRLGITRARVYQLLDDCGQVMAVRWPAGRAR